MLQLSPIQHANTKVVSINFTQSYDSMAQNLEFSCAVPLPLYPNQKIEIELVDDGIWLAGVFNRTSDGINTLYLDQELFQYKADLTVTPTTVVNIWLAFDVEGKENEVLTRADIIRLLQSTPNQMDHLKVIKYGTPGLVDGFDKLKLNQHKVNINIGPFEMLENSYSEICTIKISTAAEQADNMGQLKLIAQEAADIQLLLFDSVGNLASLTFSGNTGIKVHSCNGAIFAVKAAIVIYPNAGDQNASVIGIKISMRTSIAGSYNTLVKVSSYEDIIIGETPTLIGAVAFGVKEEYEIDAYTLGWTKAGQRIRVDANTEKAPVPYSSSEDLMLAAGHYYNTATNVYLFVAAYDTKLIQRLTEISNEGIPSTKERTYDTGTKVFSAWQVVSYVGHKHTAADVDETADRFWLSLTDKNLIKTLSDKSLGSIYQEPVNTFADLAVTYANPTKNYIVTCKDTNITWQFNVAAGKWDLHSANGLPLASDAANGLLSKEDYTKLQQTSLSKKLAVTGGSVYIHFENDPSIYAAKIDPFTIDLVKRTTLTGKLGTASISMGKNIESFGAYSIAIGTSIAANSDTEKSVFLGYDITANGFRGIGIGQGLLFDRGNTTILGQYNAPLAVKNIAFAIGGGTSADLRKNLFAVTDEGYAIANKFMLEGAIGENVLLDNGNVLSLVSFATAEALTNIDNKKVAKNKHITLTLVDDTNATTAIIVPYIAADDAYLNVE